jgi:hypothetical protein
MVSQSLDDHLNALNSGDPQRLGATHIELSSHLSTLYSRYLHEHGWRDGWQDGALCSVTRTADVYVQCAGLLIWGDDQQKFWLEPFRACFRNLETGEAPVAYKLCFRSACEDKKALPYESSAKATARISPSDVKKPIKDSDWVYVFTKGEL